MPSGRAHFLASARELGRRLTAFRRRGVASAVRCVASPSPEACHASHPRPSPLRTRRRMGCRRGVPALHPRRRLAHRARVAHSSRRRARPAPTAAPAAACRRAVPARAVSVPSLLLADGRQIRVGDTLAHVDGSRQWRSAAGRQAVDRGALGERLTRSTSTRARRSSSSSSLSSEPARSGSPRSTCLRQVTGPGSRRRCPADGSGCPCARSRLGRRPVPRLRRGRSTPFPQQRRPIAVHHHAPQPAGERHRLLDHAVRDTHEGVLQRPVGELQRDGQREIEQRARAARRARPPPGRGPTRRRARSP